MKKPKINETNLDFRSTSFFKKLLTVEAIIIHHYADDGDIYAQHRYHKNVNNWNGYGYHVEVDFDGTLNAGRPLDVRGAHAGYEWNAKSIAVVFRGNLDLRAPKESQLAAGTDVVAWLLYEHGLTIDEVLPHKEVSATVCPGQYFPWRRFIEMVDERSEKDTTIKRLRELIAGHEARIRKKNEVIKGLEKDLEKVRIEKVGHEGRIQKKRQILRSIRELIDEELS